jgi:putative transposase
LVRDRGNGLKAQPAVYRWTNGTGWAISTSREVTRVKAVNREPVIRPSGHVQYREKVRT